jgi:hypothetical protein
MRQSSAFSWYLTTLLISFVGWMPTQKTQAQIYQQTKEIGTSPIEKGRWLVQADWDGDGLQDLLIATDKGEIYLQKAQKDGHYKTFKIATGLPEKIQQILPVDLNHDKKMDLLIASQSGLHLLTGNGTPQPASWHLLLPTPVLQVAAFDFNRDQKTDLLITSSVESRRTPSAIYYRREAKLYLQQKDGSFPLTQVQELDGEVGFKILIEDLDQDGYPDAIITGYTVYHLLWNQAGKRWLHTSRTQQDIHPEALLMPRNNKQPQEVLLPTRERFTSRQNIEVWRFKGREMTRRTAFREWGPWQRQVFDLNGDGRPDFAQFRTGSVRLWSQGSDGHFQKSHRFFMDVVRDIGSLTVSPQGILSFVFLDYYGRCQHLSVLLPAAFHTFPMGITLAKSKTSPSSKTSTQPTTSSRPATSTLYQVIQDEAVAEKIRNTLETRHADLKKQSIDIYRYDAAQQKNAQTLFPTFREHYGVFLQGRQDALYQFTLQGELWPAYARFSPVAPNDIAFRGHVSADAAAGLAAIVEPIFTETLSPTWHRRVDIQHYFSWKNETKKKDRHHTFYVSKQSYSDGLDWKYWLTHVARPLGNTDPFSIIENPQVRNKIKATLKGYGFSSKTFSQMDVMHIRFGSFMQSQVHRPTHYPPLNISTTYYTIAYQGKAYSFQINGTPYRKK